MLKAIVIALIVALVFPTVLAERVELSKTVSIEIVMDEAVQVDVKVPLETIICEPENKLAKTTIKGSRLLMFLSGDGENSYSDVSAKQILEKIKELANTDIDKLEKDFLLPISGSLLEKRDWYVYQNKFRVIEGDIYSKKSPKLPNVNPPEVIGKFKLELPVGVEHKFDSSVCPSLIDPIKFDNLPEGQKYASSNTPESEKHLSSLILNEEPLAYFSNWKLNKIQEDPNSVTFLIDNSTTLFVKAIKHDTNQTIEDEAKNFLSTYGDPNNTAKKQEEEFTVYGLESETNETKTSASVYIIDEKEKSFGFVYTASKTNFDIYHDMIEFVEYSIGKEFLQKPLPGPQLIVDVLSKNCRNNIYSVNFKLDANHNQDISDLEYRIFLDSKKTDSKKIKVEAKRYSSEEIYSFNVSDHKNLEIFTIATSSNNSVSYEKENVEIDRQKCEGEKQPEPVQPQAVPEPNNNLIIFAGVIAFLIGLGLMALVKR